MLVFKYLSLPRLCLHDILSKDLENADFLNLFFNFDVRDKFVERTESVLKVFIVAYKIKFHILKQISFH